MEFNFEIRETKPILVALVCNSISGFIGAQKRFSCSGERTSGSSITAAEAEPSGMRLTVAVSPLWSYTGFGLTVSVAQPSSPSNGKCRSHDSLPGSCTDGALTTMLGAHVEPDHFYFVIAYFVTFSPVVS